MIESEEKLTRQLRVCYFGTYRANYTRNQILLAGLRAQENVVVHECHAPLWHSIEDRVEQASGGWKNPRFWWRVMSTYWQLMRVISLLCATTAFTETFMKQIFCF